MHVSRFSLPFLLTILLFNSSCAIRSKQAQPLAARRQSFEVHEHWMGVNGEKPGQKVVMIKSTHDLEQTLKELGCKQQVPCSIGRLGEVYVITKPPQHK
jgi:hypothetical protein